MATQAEAPTLCGKFRLDLLVIVENRRIGIECDGRDFHDEYRDEWRDAMILGDVRTDEIIRLRACDLTYHLDDCIFILSRLHPSMFANRHRMNLERLASNRAKNARVSVSGAIFGYGFLDGSAAVDFIDIQRRSIEGRQFWKNYYQFAIEHGGGSLDRLIELWSHTDRGIQVT